MKCFIIGTLLSTFLNFGYSQSIEWELISTIGVKDLDLISMDNRGNIFYSDRQGNVYEIDALGTVTNQYSPTLQARLNQLDTFSSLTIFLFSGDFQQTVLLDKHLVPLSNFPLSQEVFGIVKAAALGNNNVFWLFDEVGKSLKKYDYRRSELLQDQPMALIFGDGRAEVTEIQERNNLVYVHLKNEGIYIFDNQANFIKKYLVDLEQKMSLYNGHLYYIKGENVHQLNLYTGEDTRFRQPEIVKQGKVLVGSDKMVFYSTKSMQIFSYKKLN